MKREGSNNTSRNNKKRPTQMKVCGYTMHASQVLSEFNITKEQLAKDILNYRTTGLRSITNKGGAFFQPDQIYARYTKKPVKSISAVNKDGDVSLVNVMGGTGLVKDLDNSGINMNGATTGRIKEHGENSEV